MKFDATRYEDAKTILVPGAQKPLKGWETVVYTLEFTYVSK